jgi:hypothetical protein
MTVLEVGLRRMASTWSSTFDLNTAERNEAWHTRPSSQDSAGVRAPPRVYMPARGIRDSRLPKGGGPDIVQYLSLPVPTLPAHVPAPRAQQAWQRWFSVTTYKVLFTLVFLGNVVALSRLWVLYTLSLSRTLNAFSTNIFFAVVIRQEDLLNLVFNIISKIPPSTPLIIRKHFAAFHHYGGLHTGCAICSILWYIAYTVLSTKSYFHEKKASAVEIVNTTTCYLFIFLLLLICLPALPCFRAQFHNTFEKSHRFGGWLSIVVIWIHRFTTSFESLGVPLWKCPSLYLLSAITGLLVLPWLRIRRIPVSSTHLSDREMSVTFDYDNMPFCTTMRFSTSPLWEWHSFATIPMYSKRTHKYTKASILVAESGDWTRELIAKPPKYLWLRDPPTHNFLKLAQMFMKKGVLVVATGAGIGPVLSFLAQLDLDSVAPSSLSSSSRSSFSSAPTLLTYDPSRRPDIVKILWCARKPHPSIVQTLLRFDPSALILDSKDGRFDLKRMSREVVRREGLEAVFVVSNKKITDLVVRGLNREGVPAYGATFDS